ncbi:MAG: HAD-IA family hydrolase [Solirubrobacterales bacterium]
MTRALSALIFDVDGTLAETEEAHREAFNRAFADFGLPWRWNRPLYRELLKVSGGKERIRAYARRRDAARMDAGFDDLVLALHRHKTTLYTQAVATGAVAFRPGIAEVIAEAREAGLRLAIATTTSRANVVALLDGATGGAGHGWFEVIACAEDAPAKKPDPEVYTVALERLRLPAAACLALEDSNNGTRAAVAAGIPVVVTESVYTDGDDFTGALAVFPDLSRVGLARLRELHGGLSHTVGA